MAYYDYKQGKSRIESILKNKLEVYKDVNIPNDDNFMAYIEDENKPRYKTHFTQKHDAKYGYYTIVILSKLNLKNGLMSVCYE